MKVLETLREKRLLLLKTIKLAKKWKMKLAIMKLFNRCLSTSRHLAQLASQRILWKLSQLQLNCLRRSQKLTSQRPSTKISLLARSSVILEEISLRSKRFCKLTIRAWSQFSASTQVSPMLILRSPSKTSCYSAERSVCSDRVALLKSQIWWNASLRPLLLVATTKAVERSAWTDTNSWRFW